VIPVGIIVEALLPLDVAKVCTEKDELVGRFLGRSGDNVYLGELKGGGVGRIVSIPSSDATRVFQSHTIKGAERAACILRLPKSLQGATGPTGATGGTDQVSTKLGPTGPRGPTGARGRRGARGSRGIRGPRGRRDTDDKGDR
jgi:hypothetical protein